MTLAAVSAHFNMCRNIDDASACVSQYDHDVGVVLKLEVNSIKEILHDTIFKHVKMVYAFKSTV